MCGRSTVKFDLCSMRKRSIQVHELRNESCRIERRRNLIAKDVVIVTGRKRISIVKEILHDGRFDGLRSLWPEVRIGNDEGTALKSLVEPRLFNTLSVGNPQARSTDPLGAAANEKRKRRTRNSGIAKALVVNEAP